ncbi:MAG: cupin domain-containing protein [Microgenomates group bacterium]
MDNSKKLSQQINFQSGSVVSKEILNKTTGTITIFAFDKDQGLSEHKAPYDAFVMGIEGSAEITVSGTVNLVKSGESLLMPANSLHSVRALEPFKMLLIMIKS